MGFFSQFKPVSVKVFDDGNEQTIEIVNNPDNKYAPGEVVRFYENKKKNIFAMETGSYDELINKKVKKIKWSNGM